MPTTRCARRSARSEDPAATTTRNNRLCQSEPQGRGSPGARAAKQGDAVGLGFERGDGRGVEGQMSAAVERAWASGTPSASNVAGLEPEWDP